MISRHQKRQDDTPTTEEAMHKSLIIGGMEIRTNEAGLMSLTDIWSAAQVAGMADGKRDPRRWKLQDGAQFIEFIAEQLNVPQRDIYRATRGKGGSTFAHKQIALAYAKYLSPALHAQVNETYLRAKSGDVTLADEIADKATPEQQEWLARRMNGKVARNQLTSTLSAHGVQGKGFADCTNAIYRRVLGGKKSEICASRNLPSKTNLRDLMDLEQLTRTALSEIVAKKRIERYDVRGNAACEDECSKAAASVAAIN
jgi:frataxin-like iron-binding protein CyaY